MRCMHYIALAPALVLACNITRLLLVVVSTEAHSYCTSSERKGIAVRLLICGFLNPVSCMIAVVTAPLLSASAVGGVVLFRRRNSVTGSPSKEAQSNKLPHAVHTLRTTTLCTCRCQSTHATRSAYGNRARLTEYEVWLTSF